MKLFLKKNLKYALVVFIFVMVFELSANADDLLVKKTGSEIKLEENKTMTRKPEIGGDNFSFHVNGFISSGIGDYYRLTFEVESTEDANIDVTALSVGGEEFAIDSFNLKRTVNFERKELVFKANSNYRDFIFEKSDNKNFADIYIKNVRIFRLNAKNDNDKNKLRQTIIGNRKDVTLTKFKAVDNQVVYANLKTEKTILGQTFIANSEFLSGVSFDINKRDDGGQGKYKVELRTVEQKNGKTIISNNVMEFFEFTANDLDVLTKKDEMTFFPLLGLMKKGQMYYVDINNESVKTSTGYLTINGGENHDAFASGDALIKRDKKAIMIGDLNFALYNSNPATFNGNTVLSGSEIVDLGQGLGSYSYSINHQPTDLLDVERYSDGVVFNDHEGIISGSSVSDTSYEYKINTIYPFKNIHIRAEKMYMDWYDVKLYYSADENNWIEIPDLKKKNLQTFDTVINGDGVNSKEIFIKVTYDKFDSKAIELFGLRSFEVNGDLNMNIK
ncbi:MAG: hypothetical protein US63_C0004G0006 [Candidatus Moranbacteria bacterium GW2011_GWC2_37_8]|nr:MAG: hypothetical protein US63_C0004G0006 [Candidatus Moranbacteria bacterium GW2011_GWC2_37_8]KKQ62556.1 MAG: hypothetical protein US82_C0009G0006 [Parcubacteria group bacterium GW2011_GWC1_38_22]